MSEKDRLKLRLQTRDGELRLEDYANVLHGANALLKELTREITGSPDSIAWDVVELGFVCDGCGENRPAQRDEWTHRDGLDYCPKCKESR